MFERIQQLPDPTTPAELAKALRITPASVRRAIKRGELRACQTSHRGDRRIQHSAILSWLNGDRTSPPPLASNTVAREPITPIDPWVLLDTPEVCVMVGKSRGTLWRWIRDDYFPEPDKVLPGGHKAWFRATVQNWIVHGMATPALRSARK
ncbi:DNA binding domain, excisionase family [Luteitalea pratensis]|uniref:DNA binding domain, excisionase family n=1 Tax=Luteitalea pratensis TaxID=1855912 RepID=A0A143PT88_LUTPR|nr:helix-turn-helix domain-containing protein [Luteitalea pratensis]AMY11300.1 DNA binding domain, excisionase family [Luteitalea pratensis]